MRSLLQRPTPPPSLAVFRVLLGTVLAVQSLITHATLATALPAPGPLAMQFSWPGGPRLPLPLDPTVLATAIATVQALLGLLLATGWCVRLAAASSFTIVLYMLLVEHAVYQNHYWLLAHILGCFSVAATRPRELHALLRLLSTVPYAYGALAKLAEPDWMLRWQPTLRWCTLAPKSNLHVSP